MGKGKVQHSEREMGISVKISQLDTQLLQKNSRGDEFILKEFSRV